MTTAAPIEQIENPDGNLPEARRRLSDAVAGLCDPVSQVVDGQLMWTDSLYVQLREALPGEQGVGYSGIARSVPPCWIQALDLLNEVDTAVAVWLPRPNLDASEDDPEPVTVIRLQALEAAQYRPQDCRKLEQISGILESWAASFKELLNPTPRLTLPNSCPACGTAVVYRRDSSGDLVRKPALSIGEHGCECGRCHYIWAPEYYTHLAAVLGYKLPDGVLE